MIYCALRARISGNESKGVPQELTWRQNWLKQCTEFKQESGGRNCKPVGEFRCLRIQRHLPRWLVVNRKPDHRDQYRLLSEAPDASSGVTSKNALLILFFYFNTLTSASTLHASIFKTDKSSSVSTNKPAQVQHFVSNLCHTHRMAADAFKTNLPRNHSSPVAGSKTTRTGRVGPRPSGLAR